MARPTFQIDQQRLHAMREEKGFTQLQLATEVSKILGTADIRSEETLRSDYQRIERSGKTSQKTATALATVLNVSVELLQGKEGPEPFDYVQSMTALLKNQIEKKENAALQRALEREAKNGTDDALPLLATTICERIEAVQLGRNPSEIAELIALTGLSESELLSPANVLGHWFVTVASRGWNRSDIFQGVSEVIYQIKEKVGDRLDHFGSDSSIRMWRDGPWFRIEISRPNVHDPMRIDFVRCRVDDKGLRWSPPSWQDEFWLKDPLAEWAYSAANFVTDFDGKQSPCDLQRMRLVVTEHEGSYAKSLGEMVITGHLDEIPDTTKKSFLREGSAHSLFVSWLVADLQRNLMPYLVKYPAKCWRISSTACINISLLPPRSSPSVTPGVRFRIGLAEEVAPDVFASIPWRKKDMESLCHQIEGWLQKIDEPVDHIKSQHKKSTGEPE